VKNNRQNSHLVCSQPQIIVHRDLDILFGAQITLRGLNRRVTEQEFDLPQIPAILRAQFGAGAPKCSIPICLDDCSTTDQTAQSLSVSRLTFPLLETDRSSRPSSMLEAIRLRDEASRREILSRPGCSPCDRPPVDPTYFKTFELYEARKKAIPDPTTLIIVDERTGCR